LMATKHVVGFSGGIDSQACAGWVLDHFPKADVILMNSDAGGNEHPLTEEFVRWYSESVHPVVMVSPVVADMDGRESAEIARRGLNPGDPLTFDLLASLKKCWPSGTQQFCTTHLKLEPQRRWLREHLPDVEIIRYSGVRRDESERRKNTPERSWDDYFDCELVCPLVTWTKPQCFDFCKARGERINPLYTMGFNRVGCAPCVNSSKADIREWAARSPEMIDKVREWERRVGRPFLRKDKPTDPDLWIDDQVAWSRTVRGGKQLALPMVEADAAAGTCVSKYGLCE
jgi:3'-phosphoadenosine 5'-phosphosulfate sulfotransferase (PAPS reductase)/FAD synthetase